MINAIQRFFRLPRPRDIVWLILLLIPFAHQVALVLAVVSHGKADDLYAFHLQVFAGRAPAYTQYQVYVADRLLDWLFHLMPERSPAAFANLYIAFHGAFAAVAIAMLFRLCRRSASCWAAFATCLYLVSLYSIFWFDNLYHPSDPIGVIFTVWVMEVLADGLEKRGLAYLALLLISGFFWEKSVLIPVSVAGVELWTRHRSLNMRQLGVLAASVVAPWIGQIVPRMIYGSARPFLPISYWMNLTYFHVYLFSVGLIFGPSIGFFIWLRKRVSPHYLGFLMQIPAWCVIYIVARARLLEMRGLLVLVPCLYPLMAKGLDSLIEHLPNSSGGLVSSDPVHLA